MRRSPRGAGGKGEAALTFEALQGMIQGGQTVDEIRTALMGQDKPTRTALLTHRDEGWTLFHLACQMGKLQVAFCLLDLGSDVNATTPNGSTGLHFLALLGKEEASPSAVYLQLLAEVLKKGALLSPLNASGESVLHMATSRKNELAVTFFLDAGCDLNVQNRHGETALHYAVNQNSAPILTMLLDKGALDRPNSSLVTAADLAAKNKQMDLVALFEHAAFPKPQQAGHAAAGVASQGLHKSQKSLDAKTQPRVGTGGGGLAPPAVASGASPRADDDIVVWTAPENDMSEDPFADENAPASKDETELALTVAGCWETYRNEFFGKRHHVYHGTAGGDDRSLAVVLARASADGLFRGLLVSGGDWSVFSFSSELLGLYAASLDEAEQIRQVLSTNKPTGGIKWTLFKNSPHVNNGSLLLALEAKLAMRPRICVGVILGLPGQTKEAEMFENTSTVPDFEAFLNVLGERIEVSKWRHWRGTFAANEEQAAYYCAWRGFEFVFHVSTLMDAAKQRQHIGNDTVLIYYKTGSEKVETSFRGKVNACAFVVAPSAQQGNRSLALSAYYRRWIDGFVPVLPSSAVSLISQAGYLREILFTNAINCNAAAVRSGPYKTNRIRLYDQSLNELIVADEAAGGASGGADGESDAVPIPTSARKPVVAPSPRKKAVPEKAQVVVAEKSVVAVVPPTIALEELKSGWLMKRKGKMKKPSAWKKRYCVLREDGLSYYDRDTGQDERIGVIAFAQIQSVDISYSSSGGLQFSLSCVTGEYDFASCGDGSDLRGWATLLAQKSQITLSDSTVVTAGPSSTLAVSGKAAVTATGPPPPRPSPRREETHVVANPEKLAELVEQAIQYVRKKGLLRVNIFRVVEDQAEVDNLASSWEKGQRTDLEKENVDVVAGAIRKYFRDHTSLLSSAELEQFVAASKKQNEEQIEAAHALLRDKHLLMALFELLSKVDEKSATNKMGASNLAAVFAPAFLKELKNVALLMDYTKAVVSLVQFVIQHFNCCHFKDACKWSHNAVERASREETVAEREEDDDTAMINPKDQDEILVELDLEQVEKSFRPRAKGVAEMPKHVPLAAEVPRTSAVQVRSSGGTATAASAVSDATSAAPAVVAAVVPEPVKQLPATPTKVPQPRKKAPGPPPYRAPAPAPKPRSKTDAPPMGPVSPRSEAAVISPTAARREPPSPPPQDYLVPPLEDDDDVLIKSPITRKLSPPPRAVVEEDDGVLLVPSLDDPFD
jgi:hypothetical protein